MDGALKKIFIYAIKAYQILLSSWMPPRCRFYPSCSQYTLEAVEAFGPAKGLWLGIRRFSRCHPWNEGGLDPLPEK